MNRTSRTIPLCSLLLLCLGFLIGVAGAQVKPGASKQTPDIPGVDTSNMTDSERAALRQLAEKISSACGKPHSLLKSLQTDPKCKRSQIAIRTIAKWLSEGFLPSEVEDRYQSRFSAKTLPIDTAGAAVRGDPSAPVTLVEFSDFECPICKNVESVLKQILQENPKVKLIFMNYPLSRHQYAASAAAAAVAAGKQGQFWAYHAKLFANQPRFTPADLLRYAGELKLDLRRFETDMEAAKVRVEKERSIGDTLNLGGTPTFFINGRRFTENPTLENLKSWIDEELSK